MVKQWIHERIEREKESATRGLDYTWATYFVMRLWNHFDLTGDEMTLQDVQVVDHFPMIQEKDQTQMHSADAQEWLSTESSIKQ